MPSLAAWALTLIGTSVQKAGGTLFEVAPEFALMCGLSSLFLLMLHLSDSRQRS